MQKADAALYQQDRALIDRLLTSQPTPSNDQVLTAARLFSRYVNTTQEAMVSDLERVMQTWGYSVADTQGRARTIWQSGYRPIPETAQLVGSGADTQQETA